MLALNKLLIKITISKSIDEKPLNPKRKQKKKSKGLNLDIISKLNRFDTESFVVQAVNSSYCHFLFVVILESSSYSCLYLF